MGDSSNSKAGPGHENRVGIIRRSPLLFATAFLILLAIAMMHVFRDRIQEQAPAFDNALVTILTTLGIYVIVLLFLFSAAVRRWYSKPVRIIAFLAWIAMLVIPFAMIRLVTDANLQVVGVRYVWSKAPDQRLELPEVMPVDVTAGETLEITDHDFPGFLGPHRDGSIDGIEIDVDWSQHPPEILWEIPIGAGWSSFAIVGDRAFTLEQRGDAELLTCYALKSGEMIWSHMEQARHDTRLGGIGPRSTPTVSGGKVFSLGATGILLACDPLTGEVIWRKTLVTQKEAAIAADLENIAWGRAGSPLAYKDLLIVPWGDSDEGRVSLAALDPDTGEIVWTGGEEQISYCSPTLAKMGGRDQIVIINESSIAGHDPESGSQLWIHKRTGKSNADANTTQPIILPDNQFLLTKGYGLGAELIEVKQDDASGEYAVESLWADRRLLKTKLSNALAWDGYAYGLSDGILECVEIATRNRQWRGGRYGHGQILRVGKHLIVLTEKGELALVKLQPESFEELGRIPVFEGVTWNTIALSGDLLLVRNGEHAACLRLPLENGSEKNPVVSTAESSSGDSVDVEPVGSDAPNERSESTPVDSDIP